MRVEQITRDGRYSRGDALAKGRGKRFIGLELVPDDSPEWFTKLHPVIHPPVPGKPRLWLVVEVLPMGDGS